MSDFSPSGLPPLNFTEPPLRVTEIATWFNSTPSEADELLMLAKSRLSLASVYQYSELISIKHNCGLHSYVRNRHGFSLQLEAIQLSIAS